MTLAIITAIAGYAIGTLQIIALDWFRARRRHAQHLRLLRAELRRARIRDKMFRWTPGKLPPSDLVPEPPSVSPVFASTVSEIDFYLTDEFEGDNTQEALFHLLDGLDQLRRYREDVLQWVTTARGSRGTPQATQAADRAYALAGKYDEVLDIVPFQLDSALEDIERRNAFLTLRNQLARLVGTLPAGIPPAPLMPGDARLEEWKERNNRKGTDAPHVPA